MKLIDLTGKKFNMLTVLRNSGEVHGHKVMWECLCDCGKKKIICGYRVRSGSVKSCGCLRITRLRDKICKFTPEERYLKSLWKNIKTRCFNIQDGHYRFYGGRGISMFSKWISNSRIFVDWILENIGHRPSGLYSLDRINNDGNYEPGNLRWALKTEQTFNQRSSDIRKSYQRQKRVMSDCLAILNGEKSDFR